MFKTNFVKMHIMQIQLDSIDEGKMQHSPLYLLANK